MIWNETWLVKLMDFLGIDQSYHKMDSWLTLRSILLEWFYQNSQQFQTFFSPTFLPQHDILYILLAAFQECCRERHVVHDVDECPQRL